MTANPIDPALDRMSVAPGPESEARPERKGASGSADAGTDRSIVERLERNPESKEARLDRALDESMDASDPPASTQPIHNNQPPESSGYNAAAEKKLASNAAGAAGNKGVLGKILSKIGLN
ncbi:hypothetical protein [Sphingomonas hengshuiensis]|uniref:Uncharacterized protein n=1 Tax=Sphingomonas hengshuiensis TaxID=1609977 RepID=A0A7U4JAE9_9SPHN|nr:hypothetical protein [Sphingomonas hengshuiensis]AJP73189.1 hypothetical protein TS85_17430 [Sphingomonas hengshuiensis]